MTTQPWRAAFATLAVLACSPREAPRDPVVARLDGDDIHLSEIEARAALPIHRARLGLHLVIERETEELIEERLLARAAERRGLSSEALLSEAARDLPAVSATEVDRYLEAHPGDAPREAGRERVRHYLEETRRIERKLALIEALRREAEVEMLLDPPLTPRGALDLEGAASRGPETAPVTVVHFADLRAAESAGLALELMALQRELPGGLRVVLRLHPLPRDELGLRTAQLAVAARKRGVFWDLHDRIAEAGGIEAESELAAFAAALGLEEPYATLPGERDSLLRVQRDLEAASRVGVQRPPTLFVNGRYFMGLYGADALRALVLEELERSSASTL